jgi:dienelactone hydrolase
MAGAIAAGAGGMGTVTEAGIGGSAGTAAGGTGGIGGMAGVGGAAGGAAPSADDALIRGDAPTMASAMADGPYAFESYTDGFADGDEFLAGTIYYPTDAEPPFAAVVACPGFTAYQDSVAPWGPFLSSHGIVVMTIDTNTTSDSVDIRQGALMDALSSLKGEQTREGSPLKDKLHMSRFGLMGWSMGGGGTWLNANMHPELKSGITLAGHIATQAGGAGQFTTVTVPVLMLAGDADTSILGLGMSQPVYEAIPESTPKMLYEVSGASHFDISPDIGGGLFGLFGLSWQKTFLEGDERYRQFLSLPQPDNASDYRTNVK